MKIKLIYIFFFCFILLTAMFGQDAASIDVREHSTAGQKKYCPKEICLLDASTNHLICKYLIHASSSKKNHSKLTKGYSYHVKEELDMMHFALIYNIYYKVFRKKNNIILGYTFSLPKEVDNFIVNLAWKPIIRTISNP